MSVHREKAESAAADRARSLSAKWASWGFYALVAGVVLALYVPSLRFGLIWDDPLWYQQGAGQTIWQTFTSLPTYQFYRPLAILLNHQLVSSNGVINAVLAHALQIAIHLGATILAVPALQALGFDTWHARFSALVFAIHPFSYQAIAWQAPQQPVAMLCVLLAVLAADRFGKARKPALLVCSLIAYAGGLFFQESALPFVFLFFWLALRDGKESPSIKRRTWPLLHLALAVAYGLLWLYVPRRGHVTGYKFEPTVLAYLLQGVAFPLARGVAGWRFTSSIPVLILLFDACNLAPAGVGPLEKPREKDSHPIFTLDHRWPRSGVPRLVMGVRLYRLSPALSGDAGHRRVMGRVDGLGVQAGQRRLRPMCGGNSHGFGRWHLYIAMVILPEALSDRHTTSLARR